MNGCTFKISFTSRISVYFRHTFYHMHQTHPYLPRFKPSPCSSYLLSILLSNTTRPSTRTSTSISFPGFEICLSSTSQPHYYIHKLVAFIFVPFCRGLANNHLALHNSFTNINFTEIPHHAVRVDCRAGCSPLLRLGGEVQGERQGSRRWLEEEVR